VPKGGARSPRGGARGLYPPSRVSLCLPVLVYSLYVSLSLLVSSISTSLNDGEAN